MTEPSSPPPPAASLAELARVFLKLGTVGFGGPAAHIAMMEDEVVRRRRWLDRDDFLDLVGATNLIPGPNSTELAIHIGLRRAGWRGLIVAGLGFIAPAAALVTLIAWAYTRYGALPELGGVLYGIKPVLIAVIVQAMIGLGRAAVKTGFLAALGAAAVVAALVGGHELAVLAAAGLAAVLWRHRRWATGAGLWIALPGAAPVATALAARPAFGLDGLFWLFLKIGAVLFGSGYVLVAFLHAELVARLGWLSEAQLLDAVAVGQVTPGPVFTTATFVGYVLAGPAGAAVATAAIFAPAFFFVAVSAPLLKRLRASPTAAAFLDGVNVASLALMAAVAVTLGGAALVDPLTVALAGIAAVLLVRFRVNSAYLVLGSGLAGALATQLR